MFEIFQEEKVITICMLLFFVGSILIRLLLGAFYYGMIRETDNMASTDNKLLKQCKTKFANCYQLNNGVANIPVFVDKFLNRLAFGPFSFETLYHMSGQAMLLSVVCAGVGICKSIMDGRMLGEILPFYIVSFLGLYIYFSVSTIVNIKGKKRILKVNLVDYLENHFSARIEVTERDLEMLYGSSRRSRRGRNDRLSSDYGRRTVELMPFGGRIAVAGGTGAFAEAPKVVAEDNSADYIENTGRAAVGQAGRQDNVRNETDTASEESCITRSTASIINGEELEALLKELLTV